MSLATAFRTALTGDAGVLALVSTRVYWKRLPQMPTYPAITLELIDGDPNNALNAVSGLHWARVRVNSWGSTYGAAYELAAAVTAALNGQKTSTLRSLVSQGKRDFFEPEVPAYYLSEDFSTLHTESS